MSEVLVLSLVSCIHLSLNLSISNMSILQHRPDSTSQVFCMHPVDFGLTRSTKQVVDRLIVGFEHVPQVWSEEVHRLDITCVHREIPKDLSLFAEERCHALTPSSFAMKVWGTRTPFLVRHPWILDWLE
jgi:hypothetical protein